MALTRKFLAALGIEGEKIDEIITAHAETVDALKAERDSFKADAEKLPNVTAERDELKEKAKGDYESKYNALHTEFEQYKADVAGQKQKTAKTEALKAILSEIGIGEKYLPAVMRAEGANLDSLNLGDDGKIADVDKLKENLSASWSDFVVKQKTEGAPINQPPEKVPTTLHASEMSEAEYFKARKDGLHIEP